MTLTLPLVEDENDDDDSDVEVEVEVEAEVEDEIEEHQQTERRSIGWGYRFCPTTPGALQRHCCYLANVNRKCVVINSNLGPISCPISEILQVFC